MKKLLFFLSYLLISAASQAQTPKANDSLAQYFTPVSLQNPDSAWHVLKPAIEGKKLFLFGEMHGVGCNLKLQLSLFKYLHQHANVRYLILEGSPSEAYLYNWFLRKGETFFLESTAYKLFKEEREFWQGLRKFNQSLPDKDKVRVIGIDSYDEVSFIAAMYLVYWHYNQQTGAYPNQDKLLPRLKKAINRLRGINKFRKLIRQELAMYEERYRPRLGDDYEQFAQMVYNPLNKDNDKKRDYKMFQNLNKAREHYNKGNYMGIFGGLHISNNKVKHKNLYHYLTQDSTQKKQTWCAYTQYHYVFSSFTEKLELMENSGELDEEYKGVDSRKIIPFLIDHTKPASKNITLMPIKKLLRSFGKNYVTDDYLIFIKHQGAETFAPITLKVKD